MRKILALAVGLAFVPSAHGATLKARVDVLPKRAGTWTRPAGVKLAVTMRLDSSTGVTAFEVWHGPGLAFDRGKGYAECATTSLQTGGIVACPARSRLGRGVMWDEALMPDLPSGGGTRMSFINGEGRTPVAEIRASLPRVRAVVVPEVTDGAPGAWPHRTKWTLPSTLRMAAGVELSTSDVRFSYGHQPFAKYYIAAVGCPRGGWAWRVRVHTTAAGVLSARGHAPCTARR
jgi:hypothetical protein